MPVDLKIIADLLTVNNLVENQVKYVAQVIIDYKLQNTHNYSEEEV